MDASALLKAQGWRGNGHSLHTTDDSVGLAKPILASRKNNTLGIGRKNHVTSDSWWLNAFDEQLKSLDTSNKTSVVQTKTNTKLGGLLTAGAGKYSGANALYACFVSGGLLQGTVKSDREGESSTDTTPEAEVAPLARQETKEERRARREERRRRKAAKLAKKTASFSAAASAKSKDKSKKDKKETDSKKKSGKKSGKKGAAPETKEERRARKEAKRKRREDKEKRRKG